MQHDDTPGRQIGHAQFLDAGPILDFETFQDHAGCSSHAIRYRSLRAWPATRLAWASVDWLSVLNRSRTRFKTPTPTTSASCSALGSISTSSASMLEPG